MDLLQFELFNSISQTRSLTKSAEVFGITQPAVSHNIKKLENEYGIKLLTRTSRGIVLTEAGKELLPYVRTTLEAISTSRNRLRNLAEGQIGRIRIATLPARAMDYLKQCMKQVQKTNPAIQMDLDLYEGPDILNSIVNNQYDFYFTTDIQISAMTGYSNIVIGHDTLDLFVPDKYAKDLDINRLGATLNDLPFITIPLHDVQLAGPVMDLLKENSISPNFTNYYSRTDAVVAAVSAGIGFTIFPSSIEESYNFEGITRIPISGNKKNVTYIATWNETNDSPAFNVFKNAIVELFGELQSNTELSKKTK